VDTGGVTANVLVDGKQKGASGREIDRLPHGARKITVTAEGYVSQEITLKLPRGLTYLKTSLERAAGRLAVADSGVRDLVSVDGRSYGSSPVEIPDLSPGEHTITVEAARYRAVTRKVTIRAGATERIQVSLERDSGSLYVAATGAPDEVRVDDRSYGRSPVEIPNLLPGVHTLTVTAPGYEQYSRPFNVAPGPRQDIKVTLARLDAALYVAGTGVPDEVTVDGRLYGHSPVEISKLTAGPHSVAIRADGYRSLMREVTLTAGGREELRVSLEQQPGTLYVADAGTPAQVFVDDTLVGTAPATVELKPGAHSVRLEAKAYRTHRQNIEVAAGKTRELRVRLQELPPALIVRRSGVKDRVTVDDREVGPTPLTLPELSPGPHMVRIEADGYQPREERIEVALDKTVTLEPKLERERHTGAVALQFLLGPEVTGARLDARIWVDRKDPQAAPALDRQDVGGSTLVLDLAPGEHELEIEPFSARADARTVPIRQRVMVGLGQTLSCRITVGAFRSDGRTLTAIRGVQLVVQ